MKKIFSFAVMTALVLGMVSCGQQWEEKNHTNRFNISIDEISLNATSVRVTFTAPTPETRFSYNCMPKSMCQWLDANTLSDKFDQDAIGYDNASASLFPGLEHVIYVYETDEEGKRVGELEYVFVKAPNQPEQTVMATMNFNGKVSFGQQEGFISKSLYIEAENAEKSQKIFLRLMAPDMTGTFSSDQIFFHWMMESFMKVKQNEEDPNYDNADDLRIYKADLEGIYNEESDTYTYHGTIVVLDENNDSYRFSVSIACEKAQE